MDNDCLGTSASLVSYSSALRDRSWYLNHTDLPMEGRYQVTPCYPGDSKGSPRIPINPTCCRFRLGRPQGPGLYRSRGPNQHSTFWEGSGRTAASMLQELLNLQLQRGRKFKLDMMSTRDCFILWCEKLHRCTMNALKGLSCDLCSNGSFMPCDFRTTLDACMCTM